MGGTSACNAAGSLGCAFAFAFASTCALTPTSAFESDPAPSPAIASATAPAPATVSAPSAASPKAASKAASKESNVKPSGDVNDVWIADDFAHDGQIHMSSGMLSSGGFKHNVWYSNSHLSQMSMSSGSVSNLQIWQPSSSLPLAVLRLAVRIFLECPLKSRTNVTVRFRFLWPRPMPFVLTLLFLSFTFVLTLTFFDDTPFFGDPFFKNLLSAAELRAIVLAGALASDANQASALSMPIFFDSHSMLPHFLP